MPDLPPRLGLDQLRAQAGDRATFARVHGFADWAALEREVERREVFNSCDPQRLLALLAEHPGLATAPMEHWCDHPEGAEPVGYLTMLRFDARRLGLAPIPSGTGAMVGTLLDAGAPADGRPGAVETPLMTAASYGDGEVARVLIERGADLDAIAAPSAGGVPGGTALAHAAVFGMTDVLDLLVAAGARIGNLGEAAAAGDVSGFDLADPAEPERVAALRLAAGHERLAVIDELLAAGTPVDGMDAGGSTALHEAAYNGRPRSVRHLLDRGADPDRRDATHGSTPLGWCRHQHTNLGESPGHDEVEAVLAGHE